MGACTDGECEYTQHYADGSRSMGQLAIDTVSFKNQTHFHEMKNVVFGCGLIESPIMFGDRFGGILGLGPRYEFSMTKGSMFTYCIGDLKDDAHNSHYIILMGDVKSMKDRSSFNDFEKVLLRTNGQFHITTLTRIAIKHETTVTEELLDFVIFDTGSLVSYFPDNVYDALSIQVDNVVQRIIPGVIRENNPYLKQELCYLGKLDEFESSDLEVQLYFRGKDNKSVVLYWDYDSIMYQKWDSTVCMSVRPTSSVGLGTETIIGLLGQQRTQLSFDLYIDGYANCKEVVV